MEWLRKGRRSTLLLMVGFTGVALSSVDDEESE